MQVGCVCLVCGKGKRAGYRPAGARTRNRERVPEFCLSFGAPAGELFPECADFPYNTEDTQNNVISCRFAYCYTSLEMQ